MWGRFASCTPICHRRWADGPLVFSALSKPRAPQGSVPIHARLFGLILLRASAPPRLETLVPLSDAKYSQTTASLGSWEKPSGRGSEDSLVFSAFPQRLCGESTAHLNP